MSTPRPRRLAPRSLGEVADRLGVVRPAGAGGVRIRGVAHDSRAVRAGDLYAALPGARTHGGRHAAEAVAQGAVAVLSDGAFGLDVDVPVLTVADPRAGLGELAAWIYGEPSRRLMLLGVTGTNGKTTTAHLLERGLAMAGHTTGLLGTIETRIGDEVLPAGRTTPEAPDLQALLAVMVERGVTAAAMEVSSHALALGRVDGTWYTAGLFTNLGTDHLDFHGSPERYFAAKAELFRPDRCARAVVNVDDPAGRRLAAAPRVPTTTVSLAGRDGADWRAREPAREAARVLVRGDGTTVRVLGPDGLDRELRLGLAGAVNAANGLLALAGLVAVGVPVDAAAQGIGSLAHVPGRVERVHAGQPFAAFVDYAHTPEAVSALLSDLRASTRGRLVVVIGCGGERDAAKRPLMATAAVQGADLAVLTSDNPRGEDPDQILAEMTAGLPPGGWIAERDRRAAIRLAVSGLRAGDTVVVAGKGHETGQEIGGRVLPFDDRSVLVEALASAAVAPAGSGSVP